MQLRIWTYSILLAFGLIFPVITLKPVNATPAAVSTNTQGITVKKAEFGIFRINQSGKVTFIPTTNVPLREGNRYGWRILLSNYQGEIKWREVLQLPKPPETWGTDNGENFSVSANGAEAVTNNTQTVKNGVIQNSWTVLKTDPVGKHRINVYIDKRRIASFEFQVVPLNEDESYPNRI